MNCHQPKSYQKIIAIVMIIIHAIGQDVFPTIVIIAIGPIIVIILSIFSIALTMIMMC